MKKKVLFFSLILILIATVYILLHQNKSKHNEQINNYQLSIEEVELLQEGDIILRHGFGIISDAIAKFGNYPVSHCGILCRDAHQKWIVIHTVSNTLSATDGIQAEHLSSFIRGSKTNSIHIVRFKNQNDSLQKLFINQTFYYLNNHIPFDNQFNTNDSSEFYCTELIKHLYMTTYKTDIYKNYKQDILGFDPFFDKNHFQTIVSHIENEK